MLAAGSGRFSQIFSHGVGRFVQILTFGVGRLSQSSVFMIYIFLVILVLRVDIQKYFPNDAVTLQLEKRNVSTSNHQSHPPFLWEAMTGLNNTATIPSSVSSPSKFRSMLSNRMKSKILASEFLGGQPVYVSLTTIHNRIYGLYETIESIVEGTMLPDHIYIFLSKEPYLLDHGVTMEFVQSEFKNLNKLLLDFPYISIIFTENIGPHRKLLPLLAQKWEEDCVIVTVDDHEIYTKSMLSTLLTYYNATNREAVVALRARRMGLCTDAPPWRVSPYTSKGKGLWPESSPAIREMLSLPTGTGGVLYRPKFFHPIVFDRRFLNLTHTGDDLMFRLATMAKGVTVVTACLSERSACAPTSQLDGLKVFNQLMITSDDWRPESNKLYTRWQQLQQHQAEMLHQQQEYRKKRAVLQQALDKEDAQRLAELQRKQQLIQQAQSQAQGQGLAPLTNRMFPERVGEGPQDSASARGSGGASGGAAESAPSTPPTPKLLVIEEITTAGDEYGDMGDYEGGRGRYFDRSGKLKVASWKPLATVNVSAKVITNDVRWDVLNSMQGAFRRERAMRRGRRRQLRGSKNDDPRKKDSLASKFNSIGGNNVMWDQSVQFLRNEAVLDFEALLQVYAPLERGKCIYSPELIKSRDEREDSSRRGFVSKVWFTFMQQVSMSMQTMYSKECGVHECEWIQ